MTVTMRKLLSALALVLLAGPLTGVGLPLSPAAAQSTGELIIVNLVPDQPVDVYAFDIIVIDDLPSGTGSIPEALPEGLYELSATPVGAPAPLLASGFIRVKAGESATAVIHPSADGALVITKFVDDLRPVEAGGARISVRHVARAGQINVAIPGVAQIPSFGPGSSATYRTTARSVQVAATRVEDNVLLASKQGDAIAGELLILYVFSGPNGVLDIISDSLEIPQTETSPTKVSDALTLSDILRASDYKQREHGEILRLYQAVFNRAPDPAGAKYWISEIYEGLGKSQAEIASFIATDDQAEFRTAYADITTNEEFVERIYQNMLGRPAEPEGKAYWVGQMNNGLSRANTVRFVALSPEFIGLYPFAPE